ncbi:sigma-E factor regulatory protein RseB domain-containing protein [soil metagenome]
MNRNWKRWVPAAAVPLVIAGVAIAVPLSANATSSLPTKTPQEVIAMIGNSSVTAFSGTVTQTSNLGLPELPTTGASSGSAGSGSSAADAASALELLTGTHTARIYVDGPSKTRVQVLDQLAERDVVVNGADVWAYDSGKQTAVHTALPASDHALQTGSQTPEQLAQQFLDAVDPTTTVSVGGDVTVAGRSAYDLVIAPQATDTLVGTVSIAVDSATGLPLQVQVTARGASDPAFANSFTSLSLDAPSADLFSFTPPAGTAVTEKSAPAGDDAAKPGHGSASDAGKPTVIGTGWDSIVEFPAATAADLSMLTSSPLFGELTTSVDGGHVLQTTLVTVLVTTDGRVLAGSVSAARLQAAATAG